MYEFQVRFSKYNLSMKTTGRFLTLLLQMQPLNAKKQTKSDPNTSQILYICSFFLTCAIRLTKQGRVWILVFLVNIRVPFPACCSTLVTSLKLIGLNLTSYFSAILVGHVADCLFHHQGEALGFSVLRFWLFFRSVSRF